jgi:type IV pilus assembly protein PilA
MLRNRKGFTLIELLIVVVIIGILAAIAIPKFANTKGKAYVSAMKSDLKNLSSAEEAFFADSSKYTATIGAPAGVDFKGTTAVGSPSINVTTGGWNATVWHTQSTTTCGIAVNSTNPLSATAGEGEPVCK